MFEHFRAWLKNPRILNAVFLILAVIVFIAVLKHYNLYEGFSKKLTEPIQEPLNKLEHFSDKPIKIKRM
jgi:hypothetical protein